MGNMVFGEVDWNAADSEVAGKSDFARLKEGENVVRVMGNPVQFYVHWVVSATGKKVKLNSPANHPELVRRLEDAGFKRQTKWFIKILDRSDDEFRLLEVGSQVYNGVKSLYNNSRWGKVTAYDLTINRGPAGAQPLYNVTPNPKEPLSVDFKEKFVAFNDRINFDKFIAPSTPEEVAEVMGWSTGATTTTTETGVGEKTATKADFDFDFE